MQKVRYIGAPKQTMRIAGKKVEIGDIIEIEKGFEHFLTNPAFEVIEAAKVKDLPPTIIEKENDAIEDVEEDVDDVLESLDEINDDLEELKEEIEDAPKKKRGRPKRKIKKTNDTDKKEGN